MKVCDGLKSFDQNNCLDSIKRAARSFKLYFCNFKPQLASIFNDSVATRKPQNNHTSMQMVSNESF